MRSDTEFEWVPEDDQRCDVVPAAHLAVPERGSWGPLDGADYAQLATEDDPGAQILQIAASHGWVGTNAGEDERELARVSARSRGGRDRKTSR